MSTMKEDQVSDTLEDMEPVNENTNQDPVTGEVLPADGVEDELGDQDDVIDLDDLALRSEEEDHHVDREPSEEDYADMAVPESEFTAQFVQGDDA